MRKIKFDVWDKEKKCFLSYDDIFIDQDGEVYLIEERTWAYQTYMYKENITEKVEIMMFTGFTDKNGNEIYEGDIFKKASGSVFEVHFSDISSKFKAKRIHDGWNFDLYDIQQDDWELLGNIHENPELLKG